MKRGRQALINTSVGAFNGTSWEALMQLVLKAKYGSEGYQHVPATPGDFGIEGFTRSTGLAFQCYCPDFHYERKELYEKQRDKMSQDLKKLKDNEKSLSTILGGTRIKSWYLITPDVIHNKILSHAVEKQTEVRKWKLPHLHEDFTVYVHDAGYYMQEINQQKKFEGLPISLGQDLHEIPKVNEGKTEYDDNLERKTNLRMAERGALAAEGLLRVTKKSFLDHDSYFQNLYDSHPQTYFQLARALHGFENNIEEWKFTITGDPDQLVEKVKTKLQERLVGDELLSIDVTTADEIIRRTMARWLAVCQVDFY